MNDDGLTWQSTIVAFEAARPERLWDAEILLRSVLEGTIKFCFICHSDREHRARCASEYWDVLPEMSRIRAHERAKTLIEQLGDLGPDAWRPIQELILSVAELDRLRDHFPRRERRMLEQKWSFTELTCQLARTQLPAMEAMLGLLHRYFMGSLHVHQDGTGVGLIWDRDARSPDRRLVLERAHAAREISDTLSFNFFRALFLYRALGFELDPVLTLATALQPLSRELDKAAEEHRVSVYPEGRSGTTSETM